MNSIGELLLKLFNETLGLNEHLSGVIVIAISIIVWIIIGLIISKIVKLIIRRALKASKNDPRSITISKLLNSIVKYAVWFIVTLLILEELSVNIAPIIASAGVIGLAIGFGAQELVKDFISGFFIIFEGSFNVGEVVEIDGFKGNVLSLGLRTTIIENWLGERKIINNGNIGSMINYSKNDSIAIIDFGVGYSTDLERLNMLMKQFVIDMEMKYEILIETPQFLGVTELADSSINVRLLAKTPSMKHFQVERDIRKDVVAYLTTNNIEIPFPQVVIHNV